MTLADPLARLLPLADIITPDAADAPAAVRAAISAALHQSAALINTRRRLVVLGSFKTGKSSLVNALLGTQAAAVSTVEPSSAPESFRAEDYVESGLRGPWTIVDTPGLFHQPDLTQRALDELESADLAILLLSADTILSAQERVVGRRIDVTLRGNVIVVVNRMDMVDEAERADVATWAEQALRGHGNALVGSPRIFYTSLAPGGTELGWFVPWLGGILSSGSGDRIVAISRLGRVGAALQRLQSTVAAERAALEQRIELIRVGDERRLDEERARIRNDIAEGRGRVRTYRANLDRRDETFVAEAAADASAMLRAGEMGITVRWDSLLPRYAEGISDAVREAVLGLPITPPAFDLSGWLIHVESLSASHPVADVASALGDLLGQVSGDDSARQRGVAAGRWVSRAVFGSDVEERVLKAVEAAARNRLAELRPDVEEYFDRVDALLREADAYFTDWTPASTERAHLQHMLDALESVGEWAKQLLGEVGAALHDIAPSIG
ncbi:MAG TPA: GTP-binding protein [Chloroflexota bacterium]|nr:GTP-binding protein [Chloroflexota bacterium]